MSPTTSEQADIGSLALLSLIAGALVTLGSQLTTRLLSDWQPLYLPAACLLIAIEAGLVRYRMRRGIHYTVGAGRYLAAEIFTLLVLMRVVTSLSLPQSSDPLQWLRDPLSAFDTPFVICSGIGFTVALLVRNSLATMAELRPLPPAHSESQLDYELYRAANEQYGRAALGRIGTGLTWGGVLVLLSLVGQMLNVEPFGGPPLPLPPLSAVAGMLFTICAFLLYSQARLGLLHLRWSLDEATIDPGVVRTWQRSAFALVLLMAIGVLLLPRSYGLDLLGGSRIGVAVLFNGLALVALLIGVVGIGAVSLLLTIPLLLLALFGASSLTPSAPPAPIVPPPAATPLPPAEAPTNLAPGVIFWLCMGVLALYALWIVLRRQQWVLRAVERVRSGRLGRLWRRLLAWFPLMRVQAQAFATAITARLQRATPPPREGPRLRLGKLSPGELIRYFYRSTVQRALRAGIDRRRTDTPYEFGARLRDEFPDADEDISGLTDSYVRSVYGRQPSDDAEARRARSPWERLRRLLRGRRPSD